MRMLLLLQIQNRDTSLFKRIMGLFSASSDVAMSEKAVGIMWLLCYPLEEPVTLQSLPIALLPINPKDEKNRVFERASKLLLNPMTPTGVFDLVCTVLQKCPLGKLDSPKALEVARQQFERRLSAVEGLIRQYDKQYRHFLAPFGKNAAVVFPPASRYKKRTRPSSAGVDDPCAKRFSSCSLALAALTFQALFNQLNRVCSSGVSYRVRGWRLLSDVSRALARLLFEPCEALKARPIVLFLGLPTAEFLKNNPSVCLRDQPLETRLNSGGTLSLEAQELYAVKQAQRMGRLLLQLQGELLGGLSVSEAEVRIYKELYRALHEFLAKSPPEVGSADPFAPVQAHLQTLN